MNRPDPLLLEPPEATELSQFCPQSTYAPLNSSDSLLYKIMKLHLDSIAQISDGPGTQTRTPPVTAEMGEGIELVEVKNE
ncbi:hypothetical protein RUND412_010344, partial [Rhizina undulata]